MKYRVVLIESEEGFAVGCPALPGCWSQGATKEEALSNIKEAVREVLEAEKELLEQEAKREGDHFMMEEIEFAYA